MVLFGLFTEFEAFPELSGLGVQPDKAECILGKSRIGIALDTHNLLFSVVGERKGQCHQKLISVRMTRGACNTAL